MAAARRISQRCMLLLVPALTFLGLGLVLFVLQPDLPYLSHLPFSHPPPPPPDGHHHGPPPHDRPPPPPPPPGGFKHWEPPNIDPLIHGIHASDYAKIEHTDKLSPFPYTPLSTSPPADKHAPWLAAVICTPWDVERRMLIRASWMRMYKDVPFDGRFVVSNPGTQWVESIKLENSTFGDMIVLDTLREDDFTANTVKTLGFYRWLLEKSPKKYQFVSKMDTDLWLNARGFWDRFLGPRLNVPDNDMSKARAIVSNTFIGQLYYSPPHRIVFPHGSMYTVTWDMVELLADLQDEHHVVAGEDMALAVLMLKGGQKATVVNMKGNEKFDYDERDARWDGSAWAVDGTVPSAAEHALHGDQVIAVHQLKSNELWLKVADCFDENGIKEMPPSTPQPPPKDEKEEEERKKNQMQYHKSRFDAIPESYWEFIDGTWVCNGIWKTLEGIDKNPEI